MGLAAFYTPLAWPQDLPPEAWLLYLGLVTAAVALLAFSWGAARLSPTALTVATLVEPLTAVLLAAWLLGEAMTGLQWVGAAGMLAGIWGLGWRDARRAGKAVRCALTPSGCSTWTTRCTTPRPRPSVMSTPA